MVTTASNIQNNYTSFRFCDYPTIEIILKRNKPLGPKRIRALEYFVKLSPEDRMNELQAWEEAFIKAEREDLGLHPSLI